MKKLVSVLLIMVMALSMASSLAEGWFDKPKTMYVVTENLGGLNVRSEPRIADGNILQQIPYGTKVSVLGEVVVNSDWVLIENSKGKDGIGYVLRRFLSSKKPEKTKQQIEEEERLANLQELNRQLATYQPLTTPLRLIAKPARTSGWVNFRVGPGVAADRISTFPDGRELMAVGETAKWYQVVDDATGKTGYVSKLYVTVVGEIVEDVPAVAETNEKESLGKLTVNGEFSLQCKLPEGYTIQVVNMRNTKIVASITSPDAAKPVMYLSIAYDELHYDLARLNDLADEELKELEKTFTDMNDVDISYRETAYGTKLLVAREKGDDTDFVDIYTIYKGYSIEFVVTPGSEAKDGKLTDEQIKQCIDFLTELDFIPVSV